MTATVDELLQPVPRKVRPRNRNPQRLPVIAISGNDALNESGTLLATGDIETDLRSLPPTLFVSRSAADLIAQWDQHYTIRHPGTWQWRASTNERDIVRPDSFRMASRVSTAIHYFGFKNGNYHKMIDPVTMYGHSLDKIWPGDETPLYRLLQWGVALRNFCHENMLEVRPTIGGISSQFLTDPRFYPNRRRKVPSKINERAREVLPGNHYVLTVAPTSRREFTAHYLDQHRAHHYHARTTALPDSNQLYAHGLFTTLAEPVFENTWPNFYGLYCLDLQAPVSYRRSHWITRLERAFVFSNELQHLRDMGYRVNGVYAAWGSFKRDAGLGKYATWAGRQLDRYGDRPWLKPLLLSTYGTLATRPRYGESVFKLAKGGESATLATGRHEMSGKLIRATKKLEPGIANVIHRGMIEAATRSESVGFAQQLTFEGFRVLSIYADAVIVEDDPDKILPPMPEPWRCKRTLNHLQFINQQAFISGEMTKLPGVGRELRDYRQHSPGNAPRKHTMKGT